ncbi:MAG: glycine C-acetyltransferase [Cytophagales bacterium]|nr:glycine C-acetyltransferase [Cytophagales bacterium]
MLSPSFRSDVKHVLKSMSEDGLWKSEYEIVSPQGSWVDLGGGEKVLNLCANNYLGLSSHPDILKAARQTLDSRGFGLSSVRFICGTQDIHKELERDLSRFLHTEDTILYAAAFDANGGLFECLFGEKDVIISDELNHASLIDGIRLSKAQRLRYRHNDIEDLEAQLKSLSDRRQKVIVSDGVFSMDGTLAQLDAICQIAEKYQALIVIDDCHATGFVGKTGRGTHELKNVIGHVDLITGTLGKALGGASGGFTSGKKILIDLLRQKSRPYLFSNTIAPPVVGGGLAALKLLSSSSKIRDDLMKKTTYFRNKMTEAGFQIPKGEHPIVPIMLYDAKKAKDMAAALLKERIYVVGFHYPVVPQNQARIRTQISALHSIEDLDYAIHTFAKQGKKMGIL